MQIKDGVKVFIKNSRTGKFLFFLRDNKPTIPNPNMYGLLGGGLEKGEEPLEALQREIKEESNIQLYDIKKLGYQTVHHVVKENAQEQSVSSQLYVFLARTNDELDQIKLYEGQKLEYFTLEEALARNNLAPAIRQVIEKYKNKLQ